MKTRKILDLFVSYTSCGRKRLSVKVHSSLIFVLFCIAWRIFFISWELSTGVKKIIIKLKNVMSGSVVVILPVDLPDL